MDQPRLFKINDFEYNEGDDIIGSGTFGCVFRCRLKASGETVALKVLSVPQRLKKRYVSYCMAFFVHGTELWSLSLICQ